MLARIKKYIADNPKKIILATGDTKQNDPIDPLCDNLEPEQYAMHCINMLFFFQML